MIVLDTHILLWLNLQYEKIPQRIVDAIAEESIIGVSAISLWEIAMLEQKGRIELPKSVLEWFEDVLSAPKIKLLSITPEIAAHSGTLIMHGDPADRIIAATIIVYNCRLATVDGLLLKMPELKTVV
ncbi:twitching motility protein PilT [Spirochaetia bacterium]|nr:twitching motility protein PilT [Spirochaetia bacterium]